MTKKIQKHIETSLAHAGLRSDPVTGSISTPIYQTATFAHPEFGKSTGYDYSRTKNPTRDSLELVLADLEEGARASCFASGMAAIGALQSLFAPGDTLLVSHDLYGGTYRMFENIFKPWGLGIRYVDFADISHVHKNIDASVKALYIETPTNPLMRIADITALSAIAHKHNALVIVDNTFMTPYCQKPIRLGADIVVHSATKYLSGHNDTVSGVVVSATQVLGEKIAYIQNAGGAILSPFDCWLALRGLKTLAVRMDRAMDNASKLAVWLKKHPKVNETYFPGLSSHSDSKIHARQSSGPGAILSIRVKGKILARNIINSVKVFSYAESLGGVESLITYPVSQTHADIPVSTRKKLGITDNLLRLSVGIEHIDDIIADLSNALK